MPASPTSPSPPPPPLGTLPPRVPPFSPQMLLPPPGIFYQVVLPTQFHPASLQHNQRHFLAQTATPSAAAYYYHPHLPPALIALPTTRANQVRPTTHSIEDTDTPPTHAFGSPTAPSGPRPPQNQPPNPTPPPSNHQLPPPPQPPGPRPRRPRRSAAPCPHSRRRSQCVLCYELGRGGGSICVHRRRRAVCRVCRASPRSTPAANDAEENNAPDAPTDRSTLLRRRIRGPNTYVSPPPPPPHHPPPVPSVTATASSSSSSAAGSVARVIVDRASADRWRIGIVGALAAAAAVEVDDDEDDFKWGRRESGSGSGGIGGGA
ncbi:hypothetical protein DFJ73DRAFT_755450 [Zopfochytrium polystomum]|nr:hypothetical protein DFJ73DRAFT_755450 [Zopfochytrium polystomum]